MRSVDGTENRVTALVQPRPLAARAIGTTLVMVGGVLLLATIGYVGLGIYGEAQLDDLIVPEAEAPLTIEDLQRDLFVPGLIIDNSATAGDALSDSATSSTPAGSDATGPSSGTAPTSNAEISAPIGDSRPAPPPLPTDPDAALELSFGDGPSEAPIDGLVPSLPGQGFEFGPLRSEATGATTGSTIGAQFEPVDWSELPFSIGGRPRAQRMIIPAIGLDSSIVELGTRWDGPDLQWETADNAVGHHLGTPNPAELGNSVFSGHINSPFRGEGSIFRRLPEVASLLREGRTIDIILESVGGRYLYRATSTDVLLPEDVDVFRPERDPSLTLVTCVPATHYTHRFLVNAVLVGYAPA